MGELGQEMIPSNFFPESVVFENVLIGTMTGDLYEKEVEMITPAVAKRVAEFKTGRLLARRALNVFGIREWPLLADSQRCPIWPEGIVGSITHTKDFCAVVIGLKKDWAAIGIDMEQSGRIQEKLWNMLFTEQEKDFLANLPLKEQSLWATCFFSAKEAFFKYQFPITRLRVSFKPVELVVAEPFEKGKRMLTLNVLPFFPYTPWRGLTIPVHYYLSERGVFTAIWGNF